MNRREFMALCGAAAATGAMARPTTVSAAAAPRHWQLGPFVRPADGLPILRANPKAVFHDPNASRLSHWESQAAYNPAAIAWNDRLYVLFRAQGNPADGMGGAASRVGLAESTDGHHFKALPHPIFYPEPGAWQKYDWPRGCEDPRIVQTEDGTFVLTFTMYNGVARLSVATSKNLTHWTNHGPAFRKPLHGRFVNLWSKSGAIVTRKIGGKIVAAKINGLYWMYWHAYRQILVAHSPDLINWTPVLDNKGKPRLVLPKNTPGRFDSWLTEPGPPALLTDAGIILFYNGMSDGHIKHGPRIPARQYSAGQALFAADHPAHLIHRPSVPFFWPEEAWEKKGQFGPGTTFIEGLALFKKKWYLFYGGADSVVGVATAQG